MMQETNTSVLGSQERSAQPGSKETESADRPGGQREILCFLDQLVLVEVVLDHELRQVAHHLG